VDEEVAKRILAATAWPTNADMIVDCVKLGYLHEDWMVLDPTYGKGRWWTKWQPKVLVKQDRNADDSDYRAMEWQSNRFDAVAYDPDYKLNGTSRLKMDEAYGVHIPKTWQDRRSDMLHGFIECVRVTKRGGMVLAKCQDQVCSGQMRWQTEWFSDLAKILEVRKVDELQFLGKGMDQPEGRSQQHARHTYSTLLVFKKGKT
jgi:hypothetical protein